MPEGCEGMDGNKEGETLMDQRKQKEEGREEAGGASNRPEDQGRQGKAGGDAWDCSLLSAVVFAVTQWSHHCYIYHAAV